jgi:hypothetical protein
MSVHFENVRLSRCPVPVTAGSGRWLFIPVLPQVARMIAAPDAE